MRRALPAALRSRMLRLVLFALVFVLVLVWVSTCGEGEEPVARSFLRNLLRALF